MKKLLLILFLPCLLFARQGAWNGGSADMNLITNWTGLSGAIASGDTLTASSGSAAMTASADLTCSKIILTSGYSGAVTTSSRTITTTGGGFAFNGTGAFTAATCNLNLTGAGDSLLIGAGIGTITSTSTIVNINATNCFIVSNKAFTPKQLLCVNGSVTVTGSAAFGIAATTTTGITINNGRLTLSCGGAPTFTSTSGSMFSMTAPDTLNGTAAWAIRTSTNIARVTYTGSGAWAFSASASGSYTDSLKGNLDLGTASLTIGKASSGHTIFDANGYVITCGAFQLTNSNATDTAFFLLGTGTLNCASKAVPTSLTGVSVLDLGSGTVNCSGSWTNSTNANAVAVIGTSKVNFTNTDNATITSANKTFNQLRFKGTATKSITLADSLTVLDTLKDSTGGFKSAGFACNWSGDFYRYSPDSMLMSTSVITLNKANALWYRRAGSSAPMGGMSGSTIRAPSGVKYDVDTNVFVYRLFLGPVCKLSLTPARTFRCSTYTAGDFNRDTVLSNTAGQRAQLTLPANTAPDTMWAKDIYSTNKLYDTTITCLNLGNNANIVFKDILNQKYLADSTVVVVTSASPASIVLAGRVDTLRGTGFYSPCSVSVTGLAYVAATVVDSTLLYFTAGATTAGLKTVTVKNCDGKVGSANALTYLDLPIISYGGPHIDTVGKAASHAVTSTGGTVASYALTSGTLVSTMALNTGTGLISGTPGTTKGVTVYRITATNATGTGYYDWTESVISGTVPKVALGHLRIVPTSGDTAGGTSILFYADTLMTGSTCGEVDSYTVLTDSTASGTSVAHVAGDLNIVVHSGAVDSTVVFRYTAGSNKKRRGWFGFGLGTFR